MDQNQMNDFAMQQPHLPVGVLVFYGLFLILMAAANWRIFSKAGEAGWKSIIPIYNPIVFLKIVGKPWWWLFLMLIPVVNFVVLILLVLELAKAFGKSTGYGVAMIFFGFILVPMLAFGGAQYVGVKAS